MTPDQVTAAAKAVGAVEDQLNTLNTSVISLDNAQGAQTKQQQDAVAAARQAQAGVDDATKSVSDGSAKLQLVVNAAVSALTALGATIPAPEAPPAPKPPNPDGTPVS